MIALDTNVLVRYLVEDDPEQSARAARLIEGAADQGDALFVAHIVVCEVVWVLQVAYRISKPEVIATLKNLVRARHLELEDVELVRKALADFEAGKGDFADYLIRERSAARGCERVATFDKALLKDAGFFAP